MTSCNAFVLVWALAALIVIPDDQSVRYEQYLENSFEENIFKIVCAACKQLKWHSFLLQTARPLNRAISRSRTSLKSTFYSSPVSLEMQDVYQSWEGELCSIWNVWTRYVRVYTVHNVINKPTNPITHRQVLANRYSRNTTMNCQLIKRTSHQLCHDGHTAVIFYRSL